MATLGKTVAQIKRGNKVNTNLGRVLGNAKLQNDRNSLEKSAGLSVISKADQPETVPGAPATPASTSTESSSSRSTLGASSGFIKKTNTMGGLRKIMRRSLGAF